MKSPFKRLALALCIPMLSIPVLSTLSALPLMAHEDKSAVSEIKQSYLSDVKSKADLENIQVVKLASDEYASDFVVFIKKNVPLHKHLTHTETVYVLEGTGIFQYGDEKITIGPGHYVKIPKGTVHGVTVTSQIPLKVLSIQAPEFFGKDRVKVSQTFKTEV